MIGHKRAGFLANGCCSSSTATAADRVLLGSSIGGLGHDGSLHGEAARPLPARGRGEQHGRQTEGPARSLDWSKLFTRGLKWGTAEGTSCARNWVPRSGVGERASGGVLQQSGPSLDFHSDPLDR